MDNSEFPPNSEVSKRSNIEAKNVERVTSGEATRKKKSLRRRFNEMFVAGDARNTLQYVVLDVLLPAAQDMIIDAGNAALEQLFKGSSRRRGSTPPQAGPYGYINYAQYAQRSRYPSGPQRTMSRQARARHNFDEIVLNDRSEAEEVIDRLFDLVSRYESATVADLYELVGIPSTHTDQKWGWTDLQGAGVTRIRGGYLLDLPEPEPIDY